jgi:hypothetical protein
MWAQDSANTSEVVDSESHIVKRVLTRYNACQAGAEGPAV